MGAGASFGDDPYRFRRHAFIKLHNALEDKRKPLALELDRVLAKVDRDADGWISAEELVAAASLLGLNPPSASAIKAIASITGSASDDRINCRRFIEFMTDPVHKLHCAKRFDAAAHQRYEQACVESSAVISPSSPPPSPSCTPNTFSARSAIDSMQRLVLKHSSRLSSKPSLLYQLARNEPAATFAAQWAPSSGNASIKATPHLLLSCKDEKVDPCLCHQQQSSEVQAIAIYSDGKRAVFAKKKLVIIWNIESM